MDINAADFVRQNPRQLVFIVRIQDQLAADIDMAASQRKRAHLARLEDAEGIVDGSGRQLGEQLFSQLRQVLALLRGQQQIMRLYPLGLGISQPLLLLVAEDVGAVDGQRRLRQRASVGLLRACCFKKASQNKEKNEGSCKPCHCATSLCRRSTLHPRIERALPEGRFAAQC